ncbi:MAG: hypothetical protein JRJ84_25895, partial [Deltaproteobacteria bacterium]|nr:hypothetical protein [Deltaproteobacteria bacterium]
NVAADLSAVTIDHDATRTLVGNATAAIGQDGVAPHYFVFVPTAEDEVRVCPGATALADVASDCADEHVFEACDGSSATIAGADVICEDLGDAYRLSGFTGDAVGIEAFEDAGDDTGDTDDTDDPVDTDEPDDDDDDGSCGCAVDGSSGGSALLVLLVGAPLLVRRRQAAAKLRFFQ